MVLILGSIKTIFNYDTDLKSLSFFSSNIYLTKFSNGFIAVTFTSVSTGF